MCIRDSLCYAHTVSNTCTQWSKFIPSLVLFKVMTGTNSFLGLLPPLYVLYKVLVSFKTDLSKKLDTSAEFPDNRDKLIRGPV